MESFIQLVTPSNRSEWAGWYSPQRLVDEWIKYNTYKKLKKETPPATTKKNVIDCLKHLGLKNAIDRATYYRLYPGEATPCIYGLPKIHKEGAPLRPIVSSINSVTYNIAKFLATVLAPLFGNTDHHIHNSEDFTAKVRDLELDTDETMVSFDITSLFTSIPTTDALTSVKRRLEEESSLSTRTNLSPDQICLLLDLCLNTTYFTYRGDKKRHGCAMGSPVSPIVANLYIEEVEKKALNSFPGTTPTHWFRYADDTWVKIKIQEVQSFTDHINSVDTNISFTREDTKDNRLAFLDCAVIIGTGGRLEIEVYRKPHTGQYLLFDSHHPLQHKIGVIRTLNHRAQNIPTSIEAQTKEDRHLKTALRTCGYPKWAFNKAAPCSRKRTREQSSESQVQRNNLVIPYMAGVSEKLKRIFRKHNIPVYFTPTNTLRQRLVHHKDRSPKHNMSNIMYVVQCSEESSELYIDETKQLLHRRTVRHQKASAAGQ
ncbi:uncharacterized protein LOC117153005 [Anabas testudineus]|uniref:uncharacterized protein LOC117153005 n=1 Tax=Anabas testudineus TaxID=64144 RepID=UPI00143DA57E|nr:uncharacterized protein LOC117153005 [Anabas testudineus]